MASSTKRRVSIAAMQASVKQPSLLQEGGAKTTTKILEQ